MNKNKLKEIMLTYDSLIKDYFRANPRLGYEDSQYVDITWNTEEFFKNLLNICRGDIKIIAFTRIYKQGEIRCRGQFLLKPAAFEKIQSYLNKNTDCDD